MNLNGLKVAHKVFGQGTVSELDGECISICFGAAGNKKFVYPAAFESFLVAEDSAVQTKIVGEIAAAREAKEDERLAREAAYKAELERQKAEEVVKRRRKTVTKRTV